jgi:hypothetical protein
MRFCSRPKEEIDTSLIALFDLVPESDIPPLGVLLVPA